MALTHYHIFFFSSHPCPHLPLCVHISNDALYRRWILLVRLLQKWNLPTYIHQWCGILVFVRQCYSTFANRKRKRKCNWNWQARFVINCKRSEHKLFVRCMHIVHWILCEQQYVCPIIIASRALCPSLNWLNVHFYTRSYVYVEIHLAAMEIKWFWMCRIRHFNFAINNTTLAQ